MPVKKGFIKSKIYTALLLLFLVYGSLLTRYAEKQLYFDEILYQQQTPYQKIVVTRAVSSGDLRLYIDGHIQSSSRLRQRWCGYPGKGSHRVPADA